MFPLDQFGTIIDKHFVPVVDRVSDDAERLAAGNIQA
jgi:hypothetical protein